MGAQRRTFNESPATIHEAIETVLAIIDEDPDEIDQEEVETDLEERCVILEDCRMLKQYAAFHLHPERPVDTADPTAFARCYFNRPSDGPQQETVEETQEIFRILEECPASRACAANYLNPEFLGDSNSNVFLCREEILADIEALKVYAKFHLHPELPVEITDTLASRERNYFVCPSIPEREKREEAEEHHQILEDARHLEDLVQRQHIGQFLEEDYLHCIFDMDEEITIEQDENRVLDGQEVLLVATEPIRKTDGEGNNLSQSPCSIFEIA
mmetsp:Transcript_31547/g.52082  ORF Transcript_31547/g.52082 Transcript_31547/m.52082 type:complete len:272 (-) Transcript_31547:426-1241(-)|eukprot:CAMPEP_0119010086 /NCGR_PEP_ID=MMETSP1176-20130426/4781_1 /TAXON_ID=265551 /ORGANISM="Synedropsis recta cf, Strain CCMP1620" /LENGTH=271 /DNA_ID=CAMNT_0006962695 /DNA_START=50 /DNA_END=868 /DNA_ORIENTATION=+